MVENEGKIGEPVTRGNGKATVKEWVGLGVLGVTSLVVAVDLFVMLLALPKLTGDLHASSTQVLWITDIYGFLLAGFMVTMGTLGDRIGRKKVLLIGSAAFAAISVLVAFSQSAEMLIFSRALLGIAGAMIAPAALSLIRFMFPDPKENARAISIWLTCLISGSILGPLVGGLLLEHFWWGSVFLVGVPPMVIGFLLGIRLLPEYKNPEAGRLHLPSVILSLATILPLIYGIKEIAVNGWSILPVVGLVVGILFGVAFVRQQLKLSDPLVDVRLFQKPAFTIMLLAMLCNTMFPGGVMVLSTQFLQLVAGLSPLEAGLWMIPAMSGSIIGFLVSPYLARFIRPAYLIGLGLLCSIAGLLVLCLTTVDGGITPLIIGFALFNLGAGPLVTLGTGIVIGAVPPQKAGSAAAISQTGNEFGFAFGVAVVGSLGAFVYHTQTTNLPAGLSPSDAQAVRETLATAVDKAGHLPGPLGSEVLYLARNAFAQEYHTAALVSAVVMAIIAVVIVTRLKGTKPVSQEKAA
ncbi:MAG: MFS transporter [Chloroflexi bacterium]|nr:MFS transporter [Chloroflexota bacterium]OJV90267.1 MAG: MFS transporter [Chloroflexi bacterium 54-19]